MTELTIKRYVGGEVLYSLTNSSLNVLQISCLVRGEAHAQLLQAAYPNVRTVLGDLDDASLVKQEAEAADVVLRKSLIVFSIRRS